MISTATALVPLLHLTTATTTDDYTTTATTTAGRVDDGVGGGDGRGSYKVQGNETRTEEQMMVARIPLISAHAFFPRFENRSSDSRRA